MSDKVTCLVTIHGIGFQQAPEGTLPGYADQLHENLRSYLDDGKREADRILGDDPTPTPPRMGGPVYVESSWPPDTDDREEGLQRVGRWSDTVPPSVLSSEAPLINEGRRVAHIALVYSHLQDQGPLPGSAADTVARAALSLGHYSSVTGAIRMAFDDIQAIRHEPKSNGQSGGSLQVRRDAPIHTHHLLSRVVPWTRPADAIPQPSGPFATIRQLEDDVAAYVCRNDLRERVRGFVREVLHRLACRVDVDAIVVNAHSNGTVIAFDVLKDFPHTCAPAIKALVTMGSPLRKYADLFCWGTDIGSLQQVSRWANLVDQRDPVADLLVPPAEWRPDQKPELKGSLYHWINPDSGEPLRPNLEDVTVSNLEHSSGGGLQAHNYWDNRHEVIPVLGDIVRSTVRQPVHASNSGANPTV